ncbi:MAG: helix-turn-helix transcriptional regulator [Clostridiales bacterium]|mgnify:CR=1 FL=1|jgi:DNA-binding HxlR family transcriptional regulator|nr:helix-turn-helix transcriptional regulator [Clostridiales bacterium]
MLDNLPACPVETALKVLNNKWKFLIIRDLYGGTKRFGELKNSVTNISPKVLTNNLRSMEEDGLLVRKVYAEIPPRTEYTLTPLGKSLIPILSALGKWGMSFKNGMTDAGFDFEGQVSDRNTKS